MDTKPLEKEAELYIQSELIKYRFSVTKPSFDTDGTDLLIVESVKNKFTPILRVQSKGRSVNANGSNITIPVDYVDENFIVFLYVKLENYESKLFVFFSKDIVEWGINNNNYVLSFNKNSVNKEYFKEKVFGLSHANLIWDALKKAEIKKYTTVIIDSIFLNDAIEKTANIYKGIYPDKEFNLPRLLDVVKNIVHYYDNFKSTDKNVNVVYINNPDTLQKTLTTDNASSKFTLDNKVICKLTIEETEGFVKFEILDYLKRIVNSENVILVADDVLYEEALNQFKEKGVEVTLVMLNSSDGRQMYTKHFWGDIVYPLGISIGLKTYEL
ncbi:MAG: hypothetical protein QNK20_07285 [Aureibaculum sp.]|nr:hypothetical protein [Aureibaculum sp.]